MSPGLAARVVIVCVLAVAATTHAQMPAATPALAPARPVIRRPVAVIVLDVETRDPAKRLVDGINEALLSHIDLAPLPATDNAALIDSIDLDDESRLLAASKKQQRALDALRPSRRDFQAAVIDALDGQAELVHVTPRAAIAVYADLALAQGQALLAQNRQDEARRAFALAYRLDPHRTLDDVHYLPEVIQAFEAAKTPPPGTALITVKGMGRVWIDGEDIGAAPGEFKVTVGRHVVWLTGPLRETLGKDVVVTPEKPADVTIMDGNLSRRQKVQRFRVAVAQAPDPAARAAAMKQLAQFVGVKDAVLLSTVNGKVIWQTWVDRAPGFSAIREVGKEQPVELLSPLAPPHPPKPPEPVTFKIPLDTPHWYEKRTYQVSLGVAVAATVISIVLYARSGQGARPWPNDIGWDTPAPTLGRPR